MDDNERLDTFAARLAITRLGFELYESLPYKDQLVVQAEYQEFAQSRPTIGFAQYLEQTLWNTMEYISSRSTWDWTCRKVGNILNRLYGEHQRRIYIAAMSSGMQIEHYVLKHPNCLYDTKEEMHVNVLPNDQRRFMLQGAALAIKASVDGTYESGKMPKVDNADELINQASELLDRLHQKNSTVACVMEHNMRELIRLLLDGMTGKDRAWLMEQRDERGCNITLEQFCYQNPSILYQIPEVGEPT